MLNVWRLIGRSHQHRSLLLHAGLVESGVAVNGDGVNEHQIAEMGGIGGIGGILRAQTDAAKIDCFWL